VLRKLVASCAALSDTTRTIASELETNSGGDDS
jgi:hypothetical protein